MSGAFLKATAGYIAGVQQPSGAIPWFPGGILDPWDHIEAAMGLSVAGRLAGAEAVMHSVRDSSSNDRGQLPAKKSRVAMEGSRSGASQSASA